jgi:hypothetical protein
MPTIPINIPTHPTTHLQPEDHEARFASNPNLPTPQKLHSPPSHGAKPEKSALKRHPTDPVDPPVGNPDALKRAFTDPTHPMEPPMNAARAQENKMRDFCLKALSGDPNSPSELVISHLASTPSKNPRRMSSDQAKTLQQIRQDIQEGKPTDFQELKDGLKGKGVQQDKT